MDYRLNPVLSCVDPFRRVDDNSDPLVEERILLDRITSDYYQAILDWFFAFVLRDIGPASVLEVGCGTGHVLNRCREAAATKPRRAVGADLSGFLVERASQRFPAMEFHVADGTALPFETGSFDLVYISTVLVHTPDPQGIISEMTRVARPGGKVAALDQDFETAALFPGEPARTRKVLNALTDLWENGWIGRKLPAFFHRAGLDRIEVDARVRVDREFDEGFFRRIRDWVVDHGFPAPQAHAWYDELAAAKPGEFFFSRNFYLAEGIRR